MHSFVEYIERVDFDCYTGYNLKLQICQLLYIMIYKEPDLFCPFKNFFDWIQSEKFNSLSDDFIKSNNTFAQMSWRVVVDFFFAK